MSTSQKRFKVVWTRTETYKVELDYAADSADDALKFAHQDFDERPELFQCNSDTLVTGNEDWLVNESDA